MQSIQRAAIIGVTGFVGRGIPALLRENGVATTGISRAGNGSVAGVDGWQKPSNLDFSGHQAIINLAGEPIDQRWTERKRRLFHESRIGVTNQVIEAISKLSPEQRPKVLVNASAVGIYGDRGDEVLGEGSSAGSGYLAELCVEWERAADAAKAMGVKVVPVRTGIVLGRDGSAFKKLMLVFKSGIGGRLGSGQQWMPWVHLEDLRAAMVHAVLSESLSGPINGTAPNPERNVDFTSKLAAAVHRPAIFPVPGFVLKIVLGEFGGALLAGQRALPDALEADGFEFRFPTLEAALEDLV